MERGGREPTARTQKWNTLFACVEHMRICGCKCVELLRSLSSVWNLLTSCSVLFEILPCTDHRMAATWRVRTPKGYATPTLFPCDSANCDAFTIDKYFLKSTDKFAYVGEKMHIVLRQSVVFIYKWQKYAAKTKLALAASHIFAVFLNHTLFHKQLAWLLQVLSDLERQ
jgi:hypothetical protein